MTMTTSTSTTSRRVSHVFYTELTSIPMYSVDGISATRTRVYLTLAAIKILKRLRPRLSNVLFLTPSICVKYGPFQHISEAAAMQYIAANTCMPVPRVYCAFQRNGNTYIVMQRIAGSPIGHNWEQRSEESKQRLLGQLKGYVNEIRSLRSTKPGALQAVDGGKLYDMRLSGGLNGIGPFVSVDEFHAFLRDGIGSSPDQVPEVNELVHRHESSQHGTCFTHGDLNSMNILAKGDDIVGVVDWDTAGWWPEYWEYTTAINVNPFNEFWKPEVPRFLDEYPDAAQMEGLRQRQFGAF